MLDWAYKKENRYIIEDEYCSEFSNDSGKTLYSLDSKDRVIYLGSFSKTIAPTFCLGYIVLPDHLMPVWEKMHGFYYPMVSVLDQLVLAEYISNGGYRRNIKKLKSLYNEKRFILFDALRTLCGYGDVFRILPYEGGLHLLLRAETRLHEDAFRDTASEHNVGIYKLSSWERTTSSFIPKNTFMIGFGEMAKDDIIPGIAILNNAWKTLLNQ